MELIEAFDKGTVNKEIIKQLLSMLFFISILFWNVYYLHNFLIFWHEITEITLIISMMIILHCAIVVNIWLLWRIHGNISYLYKLVRVKRTAEREIEEKPTHKCQICGTTFEKEYLKCAYCQANMQCDGKIIKIEEE